MADAVGEIPKEMWALLGEHPLRSAPPGVIPDFEHPLWHGKPVVIAASICTPIMLLVASVRVYTKCYVIRKWSGDDNVFLVSLVAALMLTALCLALSCGGGYGYHAWDVKLGQFSKAVLVRSFIFSLLSNPLIWVVKLAVYSLIFHAFRPLTYIRRLIYIVLLVTGLYVVGVAVVQGTLCGPQGGYDRASYLAGFARPKCSDPTDSIQILAINSGAVLFSQDLFLLILPLPAIAKLNLPARRKAGVFLLFLTGAGACIMSAFALYFRTPLFAGSAAASRGDVTYGVVPVMTVSIIESAVGVIIPCMALCAKVFKQLSGSLTTFLSSRTTGFRRTSSSEHLPIPLHELKPQSRESDQPQLDTIDKMLMQFKPRKSKGDSAHGGSQISGRSQSESLA